MQETLLNLLRTIYAGVGVAGAIAFLPTIKDLHFHKKQSANISSFLLWTIGNGVSTTSPDRA